MLLKVKKYLVAGSFLKHTGNYIKNFFGRIRKRLDYVIGLCARKIVYARGDIQANKIFVMTNYYIGEKNLRKSSRFHAWNLSQKSRMITIRKGE